MFSEFNQVGSNAIFKSLRKTLSLAKKLQYIDNQSGITHFAYCRQFSFMLIIKGLSKS